MATDEIKIISKVVPRTRDGVSVVASSGGGTTIVEGDKSASLMLAKLFTPLTEDGTEVSVSDTTSVIKSIRANYDFWSVGAVSAKGVSTGGESGTGGLIKTVYGFSDLGKTFDSADNESTFNAYTINEIWKLAKEGGGSAIFGDIAVTGTGNAVTDVSNDNGTLTFSKGITFATKAELDTVNGKFSSYAMKTELETVSNKFSSYTTKTEFNALNTKVTDFLTGTDTDNIINKWSELETFLQGMKETDDLATILSGKADTKSVGRLFTALDSDGNEVDINDNTKIIASIRANFGLWGVSYISAKGVSSSSSTVIGATALSELTDVSLSDLSDNQVLSYDSASKSWINKAISQGLDTSAMWAALKTADSSNVIDISHIPTSSLDIRYVLSGRKVLAGTGLSGGGALTTDVTLSLAASGVTAGTYTKVTIDTYGRVTSGASLSATDIPSLDWSKITTGKPTTLAGYGITDAVTLSTAQTITGVKTLSQQLKSTVATGTAPFAISSTTLVSNLNADLLDGYHQSSFLRTDNYTSTLDERYVKKAGDTMTGDLAMNNTKGFNIGWTTRVVKTSGIWIHGGSDVASSIDANLRFGSWQGVGWYPTVSGQTVTQGNNAMWLNVRTGVLDVHSNITSHNGYLAANWDGARRLVLGASASYGWIDSRDSNNSVLCNILLQDTKVVIGKYAESSRFVSTVGAGTAPYQCSSTTLNSNLNADLLDGYHQYSFFRTDGVNQYVTLTGGSGNTEGYRLVLEATVTGGWSINGMTLLVSSRHSGTGTISLVFHTINQESTAYVGSLNYYGSNISLGNTMWRLFYNTTTKKIRLFWHYYDYSDCRVSILNRRGVTINISNGTWYTTLPSDNGNELPSYYNRTSSADVWATARTFYIQDHVSSHTGAGVSVNGSADVYLKLPSSIQCSGWFRSTGNSGWYHQTYGGGIYMADSTYVRVYGGKRFYVENAEAADLNTNNAISTAGGIYAAKTITASGNIISAAAVTAKSSSSDIRLKTDIQGYDAMDIIRKFRSVKYHWNAIAKENSEVFNHDNWNYGLIAQDLLSGGYNQWVKDIFKDYYTIDYERLIPVTWKGLQEVDDEVTRLKRRVTQLENEVKQLKEIRNVA